MSDNLSGKTIILGVTGGIAAYKAAELCSALVKKGAAVHVVMTEHATHFVGPMTFRALTGNQVITGLWDEPDGYEIAHVSLPDKADAFLVVPATANIIGKIASGIADDMLSSMIAATTSPIILAPAMNCKMWRNRITQANLERLISLGYQFVGPETGRLACGVDDIGRLAAVERIVQAVVERLTKSNDLEGIRILITAGPTREPIDPVRHLTNRSSGKMGYAIARAAEEERGADVTLVSGPTSIPVPPNVRLVNVQTAEEMLNAVLTHLPDARVVIGAAAVADYTPKSPASRKIKKSGDSISIELTPTRDIMAEVGLRKGDRLLIGFAAETDNVISNAAKKIEAKNLDFIVANDVSKPGIGFDADSNEVVILGRAGEARELAKQPKIAIANAILDLVSESLEGIERGSAESPG